MRKGQFSENPWQKLQNLFITYSVSLKEQLQIFSHSFAVIASMVLGGIMPKIALYEEYDGGEKFVPTIPKTTF